MPRSRFYALAVEEYLKQIARQNVTRRLNEVYGDEPEEVDPFLETAAVPTLRRAK